MGNSRIVQDLGNCRLGRHDHIVRGRKHRVHTPHQIVGGSDDLVCRVAVLFQTGNALAVQICLCFGDGHLGVDFGLGIQQANSLHLRLHCQHHIQQEGSIQRGGGTGHIGKPGKARAGGIGNGRVNDGNILTLGSGNHALSCGSGNGDDQIIAVGNHLRADLIQQGGIVAPVELRVTHRNARFLCLTVQLRFHSQTDFIQRGMIQLLDNSDLFGTVVFGGCPAAGQQGQGHEYGKRSAKQFFHNNFSLIQMIWLDGFGFPAPSSARLSHAATSFRK